MACPWYSSAYQRGLRSDARRQLPAVGLCGAGGLDWARQVVGCRWSFAAVESYGPALPQGVGRCKAGQGEGCLVGQVAASGG